MKSIAIVRKVPFKIAGNRIVWSVILAEREGLSLLFVQKPDEHRSHAIILAQENVAERVFEDTKANRFHLNHQDLIEISSTLRALGEGLSEAEFRNFFKPDKDWNCE